MFYLCKIKMFSFAKLIGKGGYFHFAVERTFLPCLDRERERGVLTFLKISIFD